MGRVHHPLGDGHEGKPVHGRADHRDFAGAGGRGEDGRGVPQTRHQQRDILQMEDDYNTVRPHSGVGNLAPSIYAGLSAPKMQRDGTLRYTEGSAPHPVASPSQQGSNQPGTLSIAG